jgi:hypothetical protein
MIFASVTADHQLAASLIEAGRLGPDRDADRRRD